MPGNPEYDSMDNDSTSSTDDMDWEARWQELEDGVEGESEERLSLSTRTALVYMREQWEKYSFSSTRCCAYI